MSVSNSDLIKDYIIKIVNELCTKYGLVITNSQVDSIINLYINQQGTFEEIKQLINSRVNTYIMGLKKEKIDVDNLLNQLRPVEKNNPYFGEVYKTYIIHIFDIYERISNSELSDEEKETQFNSEAANYLKEHQIKMMEYLKQQSSSVKLLDLAVDELHRGSESLTYDIVRNLYNTFINDVTIVSNDSEGKMYSTVINNQKIFEKPIKDENGNIRINPNIKYNFDMIKETYDFAKKHGKQIKFHTFLWHNAIPENLKAEIESISDLSLKREMALAFLRHYANSLSEFIKANEYDLRQIEALNEIANDKPGNDLLRDSWWKDVIGDEYYIEVLRIVKSAFPNTELIYNEYNEFVNYKADRIATIVERVRKVEESEGNTLLDGIGLQAHYTDYLREFCRPLTAMDIVESALKIQNACNDKGIYITEYDFLNFGRNGNKERLEQVFIDTYSKISNGFIIWGNSDSLTWNHCIDEKGNSMNAQIIDTNGNPKEVYIQIKEQFGIKKDYQR